ncbi:beta-glucoside bgl operon antiterminator, BglG family [Liquorilactobacillus sucicola DSM 21376 = JCM 15457]|uniref:Beta-glucoside operon antiterminator n=1 Tax=Liquorilactobacillus sucicola DSM 21376 = JCM 15457 TaxID=1423806 RepID=A0A023CYJ2_9LACO|nr:PRD domain-containing protein [Liquorilactobacillus sucicola]KRN06700.1 beta-glucoside operon antiterminator [Liquorilactobacillus sucicola DSM 21376 = JCM 15457]GAJ26968.1 beta-glucoside bgl operon antiterminator, BglG family [Liquorilactobacillus sucicola DSM 21376 = JCM 15457]
MKAVKKINNNVAVCVDNNGDELVAFGKGIGFCRMPYEIKDMRKITMTFYRLDTHNFQLLKEIPENIFEISAQIVNRAQKVLARELNPNVIFSLADHINFAIIRQKKYREMNLPFSYDVKQLYPKEFEIGKMALGLVKKQLDVNLPESESTAIAMHFINSQAANITSITSDTFNLISEKTIVIIENYFQITIDQNEFSYNRFIMHLRYYLIRIAENKQIVDEASQAIIQAFKQESPRIYECTKQIVAMIDDVLNNKSTDDELFYLMIYVKRIVVKSLNTKE